MRKTFQFGIFSVAVVVSAYGASVMAHETSSDEDHITKTYSLTDFDEIAIGGVYEVEVNVGSSYGISLTGDAKKMEQVKVYEDDGTLHLNMRKQKRKTKIKNTGNGIVAVITLPELNAFNISGVASADVDGVNSAEFGLSVAGVAEVNIEGRCEKLDARVSGVGELNAKSLKCKEAEAVLTGVGEISVFASDSVNVSATGVGEVNVYGKPEKVSKNKAFFSKVNIK